MYEPKGKKQKPSLPLKSPDEVDVPPTIGERLAAKAQEAYEQAKAQGLDENACGEAKRRKYRRRPGPKAGRVGRPSKGPAALRPPPEEDSDDSGDLPEVLTPDVIIPGERLKILEKVRRKPGEKAMDYLDRVSPELVEELVLMAMSPVKSIHPRIKLDIIKELLQRPLPTKTMIDVHSTIGNEVDRMSDDEVYEQIRQRLADLKKDNRLPPALAAPIDEDDGGTMH